MLAGKTAVITGGSRGIGRAIALTMARHGADIALLYAGNEEAAAQAVAGVEAAGRKARAYRCDVSSFEATQAAARAVLEAFGRVDILINNAGITRDGLVLAMGDAQFRDVLGVSLNGAFHMIRHLSSHLVRNRWGRIINIASVVGLCGNAGQANYAAAKAGLIGLTKSIARELAGRNITCNAIAPGFIETDMTDALGPKAREALLSRVPLGRAGDAQEVAELAVFLASDKAAYITGEVIRVDGGMCI